MKRWIGALIAVAIACIPILMARSSSLSLLEDTDTRTLLAAIRTRNAPLSWFSGDWPLKNHFYRPVSTLAFEIDNRLYGHHAAGYGLTNALLCVACVLLLFWFLRELTDRPLIAGGAAVLFAFQHVGLQNNLLLPLLVFAVLTAFAGFVRHQFEIRNWMPACLLLLYAMTEIAGMDAMGLGTIGSGTIGWLPGRTATVMTVFCLAAMAAYARYERLSAVRDESRISPLDPPATRSQKAPRSVSRFHVLWAVLSIVCALLAFGSYEQAVMLPAALLAVAVTMRANRFKVRWGWQAGFWLILAGYLVLRRLVLPPGTSGYQLQQFRSGPGVGISLLGYLLPFANEIRGFRSNIELGPIMLLTPAPYAFLISAASNVTAFYQARRRWTYALAGYGLSFITFLPMAWIKQFPHYSYWPMACRSLFAMTLLWIAFDLVINAWSPRVQQAPKRLDPAPGSLPHQ